MARINFMAEQFGDTSAPGVRAIIDRLKAKGSLSPEQLVDGCLDLIWARSKSAPTPSSSSSRKPMSGARSRGSNGSSRRRPTSMSAQMLQLIVATREYQFA